MWIGSASVLRQLPEATGSSDSPAHSRTQGSLLRPPFPASLGYIGSNQLARTVAGSS
jgi:hypothetical protein